MKRIKAISLMLSLLLILMSVTTAYSVYLDSYDEKTIQSEYDNEMNKLHFYFPINVDSSESIQTFSYQNETMNFNYINDESELDLAIENMCEFCEKSTEADSLVQMTVEFYSDFVNSREYNKLLKERENIKTAEEKEAFRSKLNALSKKHHEKENAINIKKLSDIEYENISVSTYSPFISLTIDSINVEVDNLLALAKNDTVANVSLSYQEEANDSTTWNRTLKEIGAYNTVHKGTYTGKGIKIGILENGICDVTHTNLSSKTINVDPNCTGEITDHATRVTSIISLMAPDAEIYVSNSCNASRTDKNNYRNLNDSLDWFVSQGCDVINCSYGSSGSYPINSDINNLVYGFSDTLAVYTYNKDGIFDYYINANLINVVASAGNVKTDNTTSGYNPDGYVCSPALAYNVIAVGALDCTLSLFDYDLEHRDSSSYKTTENRVKPEISAIGTVEIPNFEEVKSGTSFAAPQVTACIGLMLEKEPMLATNPRAIKALLIASATKTENYTNIANSYFDEKVGAGCVNFDEFADIDHLYYLWNKQETSIPNGFVMENTFTLSRKDDVQISAFWSATYSTSDKLAYVTNYDVYLYNSSGTLVASSTLDYGSNEFIRYTAPSAGEYTVKVYQNGEMPEEITDDYIALSCNIIS